MPPPDEPFSHLGLTPVKKKIITKMTNNNNLDGLKRTNRKEQQ
jgi:hypothetical protein